VCKVLPLLQRLKEKHSLEFSASAAAWASLSARARQRNRGLGENRRGETILTTQTFAGRLVPLLRPLGLKILIGAGRFIVGNAGILVTRVEYVKRTRAGRTLSLWMPR